MRIDPLPLPVVPHECVSLREYVEKILVERQRAVELQFTATSKYQDELGRVNEEKHQRSDERLKALENAYSNAGGRFWALGVAWTLAVAMLFWWLSHGQK